MQYIEHSGTCLDFWEYMRRLLGNIMHHFACILVTSRYIRYSIGYSENIDAYIPRINVDFYNDDLNGEIKIPSRSQESMIATLRSAIAEVLAKNHQIKAVTIGVCRYVASTGAEDKSRKHRKYGVIAKSGMNPEWVGANLFALACDEFSGIVSPEFIHVQTDVNLGALGETSFRLQNEQLFRQDGNIIREAEEYHGLDRESYLIRRTSVAYIKLSDTVDAGICTGGQLKNVGYNPLFGWKTPKRLYTRYTRDKFEGICDYHHDCYSGLIGEKAIDERLKRYGDLPYNELLTPHPIEKLIAFYAAQLCDDVNSKYFPQLIVVGGRMVFDYSAEFFEYRDLPNKINDELIRWLGDDINDDRLPNASDILRQERVSDGLGGEALRQFVQEGMCDFPVNYGGLVYAAQKYHYPTSPKVIPMIL